MKILVIGSGGREHALVWKISQGPGVERIYCAPGNAGISRSARCVDIPSSDLAGLVSFAKAEGIDLTFVGPELPLTLGIVDEFEKAGLRAFGPSRAAARLEGSKAFAKQFMISHGIPTAKARGFESAEEAVAYAREQAFPLVVKADGLAAGKGVVIARSFEEAREAIAQMLRERVFGMAGEKVLIEEFLPGEEATVLVFTDGKRAALMPPSQDHKRLLDGDRGANTGGMGAYAPAPVVSEGLREEIAARIVFPTLKGLSESGCPYKGVLYVGLMIGPEGPRVLEYNCRFGDPEAQVVLPLLKTDLVEVACAIIEGRLDEAAIDWSPLSAICVVLASQGYPGKSPQGIPIEGLDQFREDDRLILFHAGTALGQGGVVTQGGRVLGVTALDADFQKAREKVYEAVGRIHFSGMQYRRDIGARDLR